LNDKNTIGSAPIQDEYVLQMQAVAEVINEFLNPPGERKVGFIVMMFPFGPPTPDHRCNYISNADRADVVAMLREQLAYFSGMPEPKPGRG
jgi:hypothetical protein